MGSCDDSDVIIAGGGPVGLLLACELRLAEVGVVVLERTPDGADMPEVVQTTAKPTLGLTGLTVNAMALIAPGAFLWLTFAQQCLYGQPMAGIAMWFGIVLALLLCFATAISYAELSKLYPGAGSSYFFAEQAFLSKSKAYRFARIAKFTVGWASHLYYWIYPGVMVAVTAILVGYLAGQLFPSIFNSAVPSPLLMILFCLVFPFLIGYIAYRGVNASTGVNLAVNVIQITALIVFTVIAIGYRLNHGEGSKGITLNPDGVPVSKVIATQTTKDDKGNDVTNPVKDKDGNYDKRTMATAGYTDLKEFQRVEVVVTPPAPRPH
jgi:basic amino acid/polyamine antiporter, APA family